MPVRWPRLRAASFASPPFAARTPVVAFAFLAALLALVLFTTPSAAEPGSDHAHRDQAMVRIGPEGLDPSTATIGTDDAIGWLYYGSEVAIVVFDGKVAERMICETPGRFLVAGDRVYSSPMRENEFASLCRLKAGEYAYEVRLIESLTEQGPQRVLRGKIVVE